MLKKKRLKNDNSKKKKKNVVQDVQIVGSLYKSEVLR